MKMIINDILFDKIKYNLSKNIYNQFILSTAAISTFPFFQKTISLTSDHMFNL